MPYYLLIAADPQEISFEFQYHLNLCHAVGRITFDNLQDYGRYARRLVATESRPTSRRRPRHIGLFSVEHDHATHLLGRHLTEPVIAMMQRDFPHWQLSTRRGGQARYQALCEWLRPDPADENRPGLVLASSHGCRLPPGSDEQEDLQGAVVCEPEGRPPKKTVFDAADLETGTDSKDPTSSQNPTSSLEGTLVFLFGCYGAGLPVLDSFPHADPRIDIQKVFQAQPKTLAKRPFVASLPKALILAGAGAVVGHIDRGWTTSFLWSQGDRPAVETTDSLLDSLTLLLRGHRLGHCLVTLRRRHSQLGAKLAQLLDVVRTGGSVDQRRLGLYWIGVNDARNLIVIGDPAVFVPGSPDPTASVELAPELYRRLHRRAAEEQLTIEQWIELRLDAEISSRSADDG